MPDEDNEEISDAGSNSKFTQFDGESEKYLFPQSVVVTSTKIKLSTLLKKEKVERKQNKRVRGEKLYRKNIVDEELKILLSKHTTCNTKKQFYYFGRIHGIQTSHNWENSHR